MKNDPYIFASFLEAKEREKWTADGTNPLVTISRQAGSGGEEIAYRAAEILTAASNGRHPWIVVDKNLAESVIDDHHLPKRIARFFTEEQSLSIEEHLEGILGISVPRATMIEKMTQTVIRLARIGHVIFVGRAAGVITAKFPRAAHFRVIGSLERRAERVAEAQSCSWDHAAAEVRRLDEQRRHFISTNFHANVDDPTHYDLIFNTDRVSIEESARLITHLVSAPDFRVTEATKLADLRHHVLG
jgi:cytidylate kinase